MDETLNVKSAEPEEAYMQPASGILRRVGQAIARPYYAVPLALFLIALVMITSFKLVRVNEFQGDTALFFQVTDNIANHGNANSGVFENIITYLKSGILTMPAEQIAKNPLAPPAAAEGNLLSWHAYYILYPIAALTKLAPTELVLLSLYVLSFVGLVLLAYFFLRSKNIPAVAACAFCVLIISHPAWSESLLWGQFYPDRLFMLSGFALMCLATRNKPSRAALICAAVVSMLIIERAALVAGMFLLLYVALYWKVVQDRYFKLGLGGALLAYGVIILKFAIHNYYYSSFLPTNVTQVLANLYNPVLAQKAELFGLVNAVLLIIALFEWRAALIAAILMLPNVLGTIGGAEKVGWISHYHSYYFPALVWAAALGFAKAYKTFAHGSRAKGGLFFGAVAAGILFLMMLNPYSFSHVEVSPSYASNAFIFKFPEQAKIYFSGAGSQLTAQAEQLRQAVPENSVVSTPEGAMAFLYHDRTIRFLPVDIDRADYAVLAIQSRKGDDVTYGGVTSFLGPDEALKVNAAIVRRMRKAGYDFAHPTLIPGLGLAVIKRTGGLPREVR